MAGRVTPMHVTEAQALLMLAAIRRYRDCADLTEAANTYGCERMLVAAIERFRDRERLEATRR